MVNFSDVSSFDAQAFSFHAGYLTIGLLIATAVSYARQKLTRQTLEQQHALQQSVESRELLARQTAHDVRSPLAALQIVSDISDKLPEDSRFLLRDAVTRINDIANNLVTWHGGEAAVADKSVKTTHISPLLHSVVSEKRAAFRASGIRFVINETTESASCFVRLNPSGFSRAVSNLLNNAAEAMSCAGTVSADLLLQGDKITLKITDHGCGISPENIAKVGYARERVQSAWPHRDLHLTPGGQKAAGKKRRVIKEHV